MIFQSFFKKRNTVLCLLLLVFLCFLTLCPCSYREAQAEEGVEDAEENKKSYQLENITVTAEKREENVQDVPTAITVIPGTDLEDAMIETIDDVVTQVPNMTINNMNQAYSNNNVRGINGSTFIQKNPVVIYADGIPIEDVSSYDVDLNNVERVEVLRGPQGAIYGKNAIGGIINVISKKPGNTYEAKAFGELGEDDTYRLKAYVNGPIIKDELFFGLSGAYYETRGYMKNDNPGQDYFDGEEVRKAKAIFRWLPMDRVEVNLQARIEQGRDGAGPYIASDTVRYDEYRNPDDKSNKDSVSSGLNISYSSDFADFKSITTYSDAESDYRLDKSFLNTGYFEDVAVTDISLFTQELRIQSPDRENGLKWLGGLYFSMEDINYSDCSMVYNTEAWYGYNTKYNWPGAMEDETIAAFGQFTIPLIAGLDFTAGVRYERTYKNFDYKYEESRTDTGERLVYDTYTVDDNWDTVLPKCDLSWTINPDAMIYGSVTKGYLAGGFNTTGTDKNNIRFDEQTSLNYEIGAKTAWFNDKLFLNSTLFYIDINDMHVWNTPSANVWVASNAGKAHSQGVEIEAKARPLRGLDITAAIGLIEVEFDEYKMGAIDYSGKTPLYTPAYTLNLAVQYRHASGFFVRGEMEGYGKTYFDEANTIKRDPYELYNAKIGYESANWDVYLYGKNLFDKEYFSTIFCSGDNIFYGVAEPRKIGIIISMRF